ncbi:MAG: hypothetical protein ACLTXL_01845 [Clostridia bacterium]
MAGIILRVTELLEFFNPSERRLPLTYWTSSRKWWNDSGELAEQSQTNKATIIRFCKR